MFSDIKYYLKQHDEVLQSIQDPIPLPEAAYNSVMEHQCSGSISHAGYIMLSCHLLIVIRHPLT